MPEAVVTPARFAQGVTFDEYVKLCGTPENLAREGTTLGQPTTSRKDWSGFLRERYARARLSDAQAAAMRWLAAQPGGPAKVLVISEEWSSDCRRDVPYLQRLAEAGGLDLRIFTRDGPTTIVKGGPNDDSPNADLVRAYMNRRSDGDFASVPVAVFFDRDFNEVHRYVEMPAIFHKDRVVAKLRSARPGESPDEAKERFRREFFAMFETPFYDVWAQAAIDEILSALHRRAAGVV